MRYSAAFDGAAPRQLEIPRSAWKAALSRLDPALQDALYLAAEQIAAFHRKQLRTSWLDYSDDGALGQVVRPLDRVGVYTPGGTAVYPSSLLMTAVPARVAGVQEIIVCTPRGANGEISPLVLAAAEVAGVDRVFSIGGVQAIAAMAYGTETVPHVDKIFGPGNIFVVLAKRRVFGIVDIDQLPGPTETLLVADESADPELVAADLLAQAEHDPMASAILITNSPMLAHAVLEELPLQLASLERADIAGQSLAANGLVVLVPDIATAIDLANCYAPEHLCLLLHDPWSCRADGAARGRHLRRRGQPGSARRLHRRTEPRHADRRHGSLLVADQRRASSRRSSASSPPTPRALRRLGPATSTLARAEGLTAHARAIERRLERLDQD